MHLDILNKYQFQAILFSLFFTARAQVLPQTIKVDAALSMAFPGPVKRIDTLGVSLFQAVDGKITYQAVRKLQIYEQATKPEQYALIDTAASLMLRAPKFNGMSKRINDTLIGGAKGKYIVMTNQSTQRPYQVFIFVTMENRNMYSIQATSYDTETMTRKSVYWFLSHVQFHPSDN
jgi:hypothetical protein